MGEEGVEKTKARLKLIRREVLGRDIMRRTTDPGRVA